MTAFATAAEDPWRHGLSLFGDLKYPAGFRHFDYVDPQAPKGGTVRQMAFGTYDNFNPTVAGVKGSLSAGIDLVYDSLMVSSMDEVSAMYGLIAESGDFEQAISVQQGLIAQVRTAGQTGHLPRLEANLRRYEKREPVRM